MYFFKNRAKELEEEIQNLADRTNYDTSQIWPDAQAAIQERYSLPAFHLLEDGYRQGDASDDEVFEAVEAINKVEDVEVAEGSYFDFGPTVYAELDIEDDENIITDVYEYLDRKVLAQVEEEISKAIKRHWIEYYESDIREFLEENYFRTGGKIGVDYSVYIDIESGDIWEKTEASSNWMFQYGDDDRRLIVHIDSNTPAFRDYTDLIAEYHDNSSVIFENLGIENAPDGWEGMDFYERVEWVDRNEKEGAEYYDSLQREEMIEAIISNIEDEFN